MDECRMALNVTRRVGEVLGLEKECAGEKKVFVGLGRQSWERTGARRLQPTCDRREKRVFALTEQKSGGSCKQAI